MDPPPKPAPLPFPLDRTPEELVDQIAVLLIPDPFFYDPSLRSFSQINRRTRRIALPHAWKTVTCRPKSSRPPDRYIHHVSFFQTTQQLACYVEKLKVSGRELPRFLETDNSRISACTLAQLASAFPKLSTLEVEEIHVVPCPHDGVLANHPYSGDSAPSPSSVTLRYIRAPASWEPYLSFVAGDAVKTMCLAAVLPPDGDEVDDTRRPIAYLNPPYLDAYHSFRASKRELEKVRSSSLRVFHLHRALPDAGRAFGEVIQRNAGTLESILLGRQGWYAEDGVGGWDGPISLRSWKHLRLRLCKKLQTFTHEALGLARPFRTVDDEEALLKNALSQLPDQLQRFYWLSPVWHNMPLGGVVEYIHVYPWRLVAELLGTAAPQVQAIKLRIERYWPDTEEFWADNPLTKEHVAKELRDGGYKGNLTFEAEMIQSTPVPF